MRDPLYPERPKQSQCIRMYRGGIELWVSRDELASLESCVTFWTDNSLPLLFLHEDALNEYVRLDHRQSDSTD